MSDSTTSIREAPFHGIWMTRSEPLAYRILPKCGCSSIGQIFHYFDHGAFYAGDIHHVTAPILKWNDGDNAQEILERFAACKIFNFTLSRNPYRRLLSAFADKIFGYQTDGRHYRGGYIHQALASYHVKWGPRSNLIENFRNFVRFVADTIERGEPIPSDWHWTPLTAHLRYTARKNPDWRLHFTGQIEHLQRDIGRVLQLAGIPESRLPAKIPRENTTSLPAIPLTRWYGPEEADIMRRIYAEDFELMGYDLDPEETQPISGVDVEALNRAISDRLP